MNQPTVSRSLALDVFRGLTICFMIIVNTPGNGSNTFPPLLHAKWNGFTPTDLVFPSFLFAVGNAMAFVMPKWNNLSQGDVLEKIFKRTAIIFLLGFLMYWFPFMRWDGQQLSAFPLAETRIFGVLQRIALCYGIAALMIYYLKPKTSYILSAAFLLIYWYLMYTCGDAADPYGLETNAAIKLDKWLVGENHMYHGEGVAFDPEGLLSTLPAIANVCFGYWAGDLARKKGSSWETIALLGLAGGLFLFLSYCWAPFFPINKKIWTSSYVCLTVGLDCLIIASIMYLTDMLNRKSWATFFVIFGRNPLFIYILSEILAILLYFFKTSDGKPYYQHLYELVYAPIGGKISSLLFALTIMMVCWLVAWLLDRRKIYVRV